MATATLNPALTAVRGRVGDIVFKTYRARGGNKIVVSRVPRFEGYVPSPAQTARRARLREATAYAQRVYADPALKARYLAAAQKLGRSAFRLAVSDCLRGLRRDAPPAPSLLPVGAAFSSRRSLGVGGTPRSPASGNAAPPAISASESRPVSPSAGSGP